METMNIAKMFQMQQILRDRIGYKETDRFEKLILALLVELGELANEWRGFKFWSSNQKPRIKAVRVPSMLEEDKEYYNPMLEEFVDGLHFILEIGLEIGINDSQPKTLISFQNKATSMDFSCIYYLVSQLDLTVLLVDKSNYHRLFNNYFHLGEKLGFSWKQIEQAYMDKNAVNHQRQEQGY